MICVTLQEYKFQNKRCSPEGRFYMIAIRILLLLLLLLLLFIYLFIYFCSTSDTCSA